MILLVLLRQIKLLDLIVIQARILLQPGQRRDFRSKYMGLQQMGVTRVLRFMSAVIMLVSLDWTQL